MNVQYVYDGLNLIVPISEKLMPKTAEYIFGMISENATVEIEDIKTIVNNYYVSCAYIYYPKNGIYKSTSFDWEPAYQKDAYAIMEEGPIKCGDTFLAIQYTDENGYGRTAFIKLGTDTTGFIRRYKY